MHIQWLFYPTVKKSGQLQILGKLRCSQVTSFEKNFGSKLLKVLSSGLVLGFSLRRKSLPYTNAQIVLATKKNNTWFYFSFFFLDYMLTLTTLLKEVLEYILAKVN